MNIIISNSSSEPIYQQIVMQLKHLILTGKLSEAEALPSIRSLAKELQISVITTKRAYEDLEREGYIETVAGKGSFVAAQNQELLREQRLRVVEEKVAEAINAAKIAGLSRNELLDMFKLLYEDS
ncbi:putative transcriptional regulator [Desulfosporosinus acidiphilus SJ4]|uniref:Putative transcriptional regulator n=1 Tax=Desulfosporosinus acidiphilus (strain DSM 22704 / JCM 16185 / SJ4) TaxID=646529 RepID=I4DCB1_DESAJ|nr:GntR family transcriptional regulator [Desulfosporosinus acidiphilus]AFM43435.1 putative transcriptional regulator [Desulfosporosinus acidiphilus SJ4]